MIRLSLFKHRSSAANPYSFLSAFCSLFFTLCSLLFLPAQAQIKYEVEAQAIGTTNGVVPFWMRSNQYGSIPMSGASTSFIGRTGREYDTKVDSSGKTKLWDWGMGFEGRVNNNVQNTEYILTEGYLKGRLGIFELRAGRSKQTMGLTGDTSLTSGSFAISGNSLGIPELKFSLPKYLKISILGGFIGIRGSYSHGWLGRIPLHKNSNRTSNSAKTYFHQKSLYAILGNQKYSLRGGVSHQAFWGSEATFLPTSYNLNPVETYLHVVLGKPYGNANIPRSKIGNHLGSVDVGLDYLFKGYRIGIFRQNFYDVGALFRLANLRDGLQGIYMENISWNKQRVTWRKLLFEVLTTTNQAGELHSKLTNSGDEDYYNNYLYSQGWSYHKQSLGTPFISTRQSIRDGQGVHTEEYFSNNRLRAFHLGALFGNGRWQILSKMSYSINLGTFATTIGNSRGSSRDRPVVNFIPQRQLSTYIEGQQVFGRGFFYNFGIGYDTHGLLEQSFGAIFRITKTLK